MKILAKVMKINRNIGLKRGKVNYEFKEFTAGIV
ncbi:hypothetical protein JMUB3935_1275 [Leptotrichia trevisanii]|uniref:Uncharacterized protein n=1 Tax=Leptotrichia trevisanii TaxID=109328 RepID=A0A510KLY9_9FUSO|nr:hypothetical protein JMUB3935_1275 [Leptotrichia trevisanii]